MRLWGIYSFSLPIASLVPYINQYPSTSLWHFLCFFHLVDSHHNVLTYLLEQIKKLQRNGTVEHEFSIFWVPRRTLVCNQILEDEGIIGDVNITEFPLYFLPLESDILSLELGDAFPDLYLV